MNRFVFASVVILCSACALRQTTGDQALSFTVPSSADTLLARARAELSELGYEVTPNEDRLVITTPRPIPDSLAGTDSAGADLTGQLWVLRVSATNQAYSAGSRATVSAFMFPAGPRDQSAGNVIYEKATPITRTSNPALFTEVQRVAERIQDAAVRPDR